MNRELDVKFSTKTFRYKKMSYIHFHKFAQIRCKERNVQFNIQAFRKFCNPLSMIFVLSELYKICYPLPNDRP